MERGEGPSSSQFPKGTKMETAGHRLAFFCEAHRPATEAAESRTIRGPAAARLNLALLHRNVNNESFSDLSPVTQCQVFRWLLDEQEKQRLDFISDKAYSVVLNRAVDGKPADHSVAMGILVCAASSAQSSKAKETVQLSAKKTEKKKSKKNKA
mmetsp:Transcript_55170/g.108968  ORF Transcript_55170/g.108968 Transcript_55170/m.108968 type:complete len:154 (+) Transcript_55170:3-464(+)